MSLIGTALSIIADVVTDTVKANQAKKRVDKLKLSAAELDKEYEASQKTDFMNTAPAKEITEKVFNAKKMGEAAENSFFNYGAATPESRVAKAAKSNIEYNDVIKEIVALGVKKREEEQKEYIRNKQLIENKIFTAENSKDASSGMKLNFDFTKNQKYV